MTTTSRSIYAVAGIRKDRLSEESAIDLKVETKVEWYLLQTQPLSSSSTVVDLPLSEGNPLLSKYVDMKIEFTRIGAEENLNKTEEAATKWLSQVINDFFFFFLLCGVQFYFIKNARRWRFQHIANHTGVFGLARSLYSNQCICTLIQSALKLIVEHVK